MLNEAKSLLLFIAANFGEFSHCIKCSDVVSLNRILMSKDPYFVGLPENITKGELAT